MQDVGNIADFYDLFSPYELYRISIYENYRYFVTNGPSDLNYRYPEYYAKLLLEDFISKADAALESGNASSTESCCGTLLQMERCQKILYGLYVHSCTA